VEGSTVNFLSHGLSEKAANFSPTSRRFAPCANPATPRNRSQLPYGKPRSARRSTDITRKLGISEATFYVWKKRFGSLGTPEIHELRQLRDENA
jgi:hypothetical protein